jgi:hypothetical protein
MLQLEFERNHLQPMAQQLVKIFQQIRLRNSSRDTTYKFKNNKRVCTLFTVYGVTG